MTSLPVGLHDLSPNQIAAVVTTLECRLGDSDRPNRSAPTGLTLHHRSPVPTGWYRDLFGRVGAPWLWTSRLLLDEHALAAILDDPAVVVLAVQEAGTDCGLLELDFRQIGACEIAFLGLLPSHLGRGAGGWLLDEAIRHARARAAERIWVHTCTLDHPAALGVYRRHGFVPVRRQVEVMDDPRLLGLLPAEAAPQVPML